MYSLLESLTFCEGEGIRFCNDGNNIDYVGQFLQYDNVNWFQTDISTFGK
jgi:hypothetical protein